MLLDLPSPALPARAAEARRAACPTLAAPMATGDGYLARLPPLLTPMDARQLSGLAAAAARFGNGAIEISRRGSLQIRGLPTPDSTGLAEALRDYGFAFADGPPIAADPLWPLFAQDVDPEAIAAGIRARIAGLVLSPKLSIVLDLGTPFAPDELAADIRIRIRGTTAAIALGGDERSAVPIGHVAKKDAAAAAAGILVRLATFGAAARLAGRDGLAALPAFAAAIRPWRIGAGLEDVPEPVANGPAVRAVAFPFGQAEAAGLSALAAMASSAAIAPASGRRLLFAGTADVVSAVAEKAESLGFVTDPADPRLSIFACAGSAGCLSGSIPSRRIVAEVAERATALFDGSVSLHVAGCTKGCAAPEATTLTFVGTGDGATFGFRQTACGAGSGTLSPKWIADGLARLAEAAARSRGPGETMAETLDRLGAETVRRVVEADGAGVA